MTPRGRNRIVSLSIVCLYVFSYLLPTEGQPTLLAEATRKHSLWAAVRAAVAPTVMVGRKPALPAVLDDGVSILALTGVPNSATVMITAVPATGNHPTAPAVSGDLVILPAFTGNYVTAVRPSESAPALAPATPETPANHAGSRAYDAVSIGSTNVRTGPGTDYEGAAVLPAGARLTLLGQHENWFLVARNGAQEGWVMGSALAFAPGFDAAGLPALEGPRRAAAVRHDATTLTAVNIYTGPSEQYPLAARNVPAETAVVIAGRIPAGDWVQIADPQGLAGWVTASALSYRSDFNLSAVPVVQLPAPLTVELFEWGGQTHDLVYTGLMRNVGMRWVKVQYKWRPNSRPSDVQDLIQKAHAAGLRILLAVPGQPHPDHIDYAAYVAFLRGVATLNPAPDAIEVWNEMNIDFEWPAGAIDPATYVNQMLAPAYAAIKRANPNIMVISGAPAPTGFDNGRNAWADDRYVAGMAGAGAAAYLDCVGVHYNAGATSPTATSGHPAGDYYGWYYLPSLAMYYQAFDGQRPLCITEIGYLTAEGWQDKQLPARFWWARNTSLEQQGAWLSQAIQVARDARFVRMLIVFSVNIHHWDDTDPQGGYALVRADGSCPACRWLSVGEGQWPPGTAGALFNPEERP